MDKKTKNLNQMNNELDKRLSEENNSVMTEIVCYLRGANISEHDQEVVRHDLLEMVLSAQERNEDIKTVFGEDFKSFCDEIIAALPPKSIKDRILDYIDTILLSTSILGALNIIISKETIDLFRNIFTRQPLNFSISITIGSLLSYLIILVSAFLIVQFICKNSFKPPLQSKALRFFAGAAAGVGIVAVFRLIMHFGRRTLFTVNIFAACLLTLLLFFAHVLLEKYIDKQ